MKLKVQNIKLNEVIVLLEKLPLKGLKSIYRTRLAQELTGKLERVIEEERTIRKELCHLDDEGEPKVKEDGSLDVKDREEFNKVMSEFYESEVIIDGGDSQVALRSVKQSLEETELEFEGKESYTFAYLYEAIQGGESEGAEDVE